MSGLVVRNMVLQNGQDHFCIKLLNELGVQKIVGISLNILFLGNIVTSNVHNMKK